MKLSKITGEKRLKSSHRLTCAPGNPHRLSAELSAEAMEAGGQRDDACRELKEKSCQLKSQQRCPLEMKDRKPFQEEHKWREVITTRLLMRGAERNLQVEMDGH